ncbi:hypothetical protein DL240_15665 [Lujinxingia litoralis]|uniref:Uncharacterized protein n=2 Tax=Lujinxingia litoralis TaxID=2211119 RepID=A0A328C3B9_9DELT|nr:hypothetical protein DL240_15665 [Lujinxingia litoralis]
MIGWALVLLAVGAMGCSEMRYTIRQVDSQHEGQFYTLQTAGERVTRLGPLYEQVEAVGINYWRCGKGEGKMTCTKVCEDQGARVCAPGLAGMYGRVSLPPSGMVSGPKQEAPVEVDEASAEEVEETPVEADEVPAEESTPDQEVQ